MTFFFGKKNSASTFWRAAFSSETFGGSRT